MSDSFSALLDHLGSSMVDLYFIPEKEDVSWVNFVKGYVKCCGRLSASMSFNRLLRLFAVTARKAGLPLKLEFESDEADCKINGFLKPADVLMLLCMCWTMSWDSRAKSLKEQQNLYLPDLGHLVLSAVLSCAEVGSDLNLWEWDISGLEIELPIGNFLTWAFTTVPAITDCFIQFFHARLENCSTVKEKSESLKSTLGQTLTKTYDDCLLDCGRAWAVSLTFTSTMSEEILKSCFPSDDGGRDENLLYRSSLHGRGLNRFWSNIEGYHAPLFILVSASSADIHENSTTERKWMIGVLIHQGLESKDVFYGSSGNLYAISPVFHVFPPTGKEKNFVYSHLHPTGRVYEPHPKPVGIAFGGTIGNERIFIDEDFDRVVVRHHAIDKTYKPGSLAPNQGFLPVESRISEVEVWGLGGRRAREVQNSYKKREELFTEQRRKVDLKTFANWEDSPEKMMMDMMSDPNSVQREDR
ncbi:uncharacterized protein LOC110820205 isoform X2 [Carica papaya]|nr:uncharacterized protein LOC110820205 isoform X2 [Carica papaya]